jgi:exopolysaccharide biosynthesis polyprenyl glycosylphosphotransferase
MSTIEEMAVLDGIVVSGTTGPPHAEHDARRLSTMRLRAHLVVADALAFGVAWYLVLFGHAHHGLILASVACATAAILWLAAHGMYRPADKASRSLETAQLFEVGLITALVAHVIDSDIGLGIGWRRELIGAVLGVLLAQSARVMADGPPSSPRNNRFLRRTIVAGSGGSTDDIADRLAAEPHLGHTVVARVLSTHVEDIVRGARATAADTVLLTADGPEAIDMAALVRGVTSAGLDLELVGGMTLIHPRRVRSVPFGRDSALRVEATTLSRWQLALKRPFDIGASAVLLVLLAPVMLLAILAIKLQDGNPVLFRQERVGKNGRRFIMFKLRSMVVDAEDRLAEVAATNQRTGPLFKVSDDPRVTAIGRILRATSIDELPQLWNVLRGEMSLVGPRPALPVEVEAFGPDLLRRHTVTPGITGLWQVEGRDLADFRAYEESDLFYVENWSISLDMAILVRTVVTIGGRVFRAGSRSSGDIVRE